MTTPVVATPEGTISWSAFEEILLDLVRSKLMHRAGRDAERQAALRHELETIREAYLRAHALVFPGENTGPKAWERMLSVGLDHPAGPGEHAPSFDDLVDDVHDAADRAEAVR